MLKLSFIINNSITDVADKLLCSEEINILFESLILSFKNFFEKEIWFLTCLYEKIG